MSKPWFIEHRYDDNVLASFYGSLASGLDSRLLPLSDYIKEAWTVIEPGREFIGNWHIDCIAEHLEAVSAGEIKRLVINLPPRSGKSNLTSVFWPTWSWTCKPWTRWIFSSYSSSLSVKHSVDRRTIFNSPWFQEHWGNVVTLASDQNQKTEFQNTERGHMIATSVGGTATGKGGDFIVVDDLINPTEAESKLQRESAVEFFDRTLTTRLDDKKNGAIVVIEQRLHTNDLTGHVLKQGGYVHLVLPAEAPRRMVTVFPRTKKEVVRESGDILSPSREGLAELTQQKAAMGTRAYQAQYQQDPTSEEGGLLKRGWWKYYTAIPHSIRRGWFWDTAMEEGEESDYTVGLLLNYCANGVYVERMVRARMQYPELKKTVLNEWNARPGDVLVIEDKVSGKSLQQDLHRDTALPVVAFKIHGNKDKTFRVSLASPWAESGRIFLPENAPWTADFIEECAAFPSGEHDDIPDALSQGIIYFAQGSQYPISALSSHNLVNPAPALPDWA